MKQLLSFPFRMLMKGSVLALCLSRVKCLFSSSLNHSFKSNEPFMFIYVRPGKKIICGAALLLDLNHSLVSVCAHLYIVILYIFTLFLLVNQSAYH